MPTAVKGLLRHRYESIVLHYKRYKFMLPCSKPDKALVLGRVATSDLRQPNCEGRPSTGNGGRA